MQPRILSQPRRKINLLYALLVPLVLLILVTVSLVGYVSYLNGRRAVSEVTRQLRTEITGRIEDHLRHFLMIPHQVTNQNATDVSEGLLDPADQHALMLHFWRQIGIFKSITSVYFGNTDGGLVNSGREGAAGDRYVILTDDFTRGPLVKYTVDTQGNPGDVLFRIPDFDATSRHWYGDTVKKGGPTWSPVYILSTQQDMAIAAGRPVYDREGGLLGVMSVDIFLSHLNYFLEHLEIGKTGEAFIVERSGLLIATSTGERPFINREGLKELSRLNAANSPTPLITLSMRALQDQTEGLGSITGKRQLEFEVDGQRQYLQVSPVRTEPALDWLIVVVVPEADFMARIHAGNRTTVLLIAAALAIALALVFFTARLITIPVARLNTAARSLADGDQTRAVTDRTSLKELFELTETFNLMSTRLQLAMSELQRENEERREVEEALRATTGRLQGILDNSPLLISEIDKDGRYLVVNRAACAVLGGEPSELAGKHFQDLVPPPIAEIFASRIQQVCDTRHPIAVNDRVMGADDIERVYHSVLFPLFDADGGVSSLAGIAQDITERMQAEESLRESEERLALVLEGAGLGAWDWWPQTGRLIFNARWAGMLGYSLDEIDQDIESFEKLVHPDDAPLVEGAQRRHLNGESRRYEVEHRLAHKSGGWVWVLGQGRVIERDSEGRPVRVCGTHQDITRRKRAEEEKERLQQQLTHAQKMESVGTLAGGVAHDFNNLLQAISGFTQMLLMDADPKDQCVSYLNSILRATDRAATLVRQLLLFSRKTGAQRVRLEFNHEIQQAVEIVRHTIPKMVEVVFLPDENLPAVDADPVQVEQIVLNLCGNAADAMPEGGRLTILTEKVTLEDALPGQQIRTEPGDYILLTVSDTGHGMDAETMEHIFEPFYTTKEIGKGTGLGLASVYGIVKSHDGYISCYSRVGQGTTFSIYLPAALSTEVERKEETEKGFGKGGTETILLADDEEAIRDFASQALRIFGYKVLIASSGEEALKIYTDGSEPIDLVILDIGMPGMGGYSCLKEIIRQDPAAKIIMASGYSVHEHMKPVLDAGAAAYVNKPYQIDEILSAVRSVLDEQDRTQT